MAVIVGQGISVSPVADAELSHESTSTVQNKVVTDAIASEYSTSKTYSVGDVCTHDGKLYECIVDIPTAEGWTLAHWKVSNLGDVASDLNRHLSDVEEKIDFEIAFSDLLSVGAFVGSSGKWVAGSSKDLPIIGNTYRYVTVTANSVNGCGVSFLFLVRHTVNGSVGFVDDGRHWIPAGQTQIFLIPSGCTFINFSDVYSETDYSPSKIVISNYSESQYIFSTLNNSYGVNLWEITSSCDNTSINSSGAQASNSDYKSTWYIPVQEGELLIGRGARYAFYDSRKAFISGATGVFNTVGTPIGGDMFYIKVPTGAAYFKICGNKQNSIYQFVLYKGSQFDNYIESQIEKPVTMGLKLYTLGDSITRGMYAESGASSSSGPTSKGYPYWIGAINGYTVVNLGNSGSGWANVGSPESQDDPSTAYNAKGVVDNNTFADADIITLAFGVNDWKGAAQNVVLGDMTSTSGDGTVIGNMKYCIETLVTKKPTAQIIVLLPLNTNRQWSGMREMTLAENWAFGYAYRNDQTLQDYRTAIRQCAEYYNVKVVDLEEVCPINRLNIRNVCGDGLHPTTAFYKQMGIALAPLIR